MFPEDLKIFDFADCEALKKEGYCFFFTNFFKKETEEAVVLYPFKNRADALNYSLKITKDEPFIIEIDDELKTISQKLSDIKIYLQVQ
ncbi:MAG: hypothetical protein Q7W45_04310 [Bacteroidota bacterium]|nr:hypothetical protein [Bacteroidota bacterium]MDP3144671.1 hypothetical protein [Bacteroidota bacterium]MDP3557007.1 hypothetical protein [Bacteroidota bacterium]